MTQNTLYSRGNPFTVVAPTGTYSASDSELVISDGSEITLPSPAQDAVVAVRAPVNGSTAVSTPGSSTVQLQSRLYLSDGKRELFVSDGNDWYGVSGNVPVIPDTVVEQFDSGNLDAYYNVNGVEISQQEVYSGSNSIRYFNEQQPQVMHRTDGVGPEQGDIFSAVLRDETGSNDLRGGIGFGFESVESDSTGYLTYMHYPNDEIYIRKTTDGSVGTILASKSLSSTPENEWVKHKVYWHPDNLIEVEVWTIDTSANNIKKAENTLIGSVSVTDSSRTSGTLGWAGTPAFGNEYTYRDYYVIEEKGVL